MKVGEVLEFNWHYFFISLSRRSHIALGTGWTGSQQYCGTYSLGEGDRSCSRWNIKDKK